MEYENNQEYLIKKTKGSSSNGNKGGEKKQDYTILLYIILGVLVITIASLAYQLYEKNELVDHLYYKESQLEDKVRSMKKKINNMEEKTFTLGPEAAMGGESSWGFDNGYVMWLKAETPIKIKSFKVKSNESGELNVILYDENDTMIQEKQLKVKGGSYVTCRVDFELKKPGRYYLKLQDNAPVRLRYHYAQEKEFYKYSNGLLSITGCCSYSSRKNGKSDTSYYQYFYDIKYGVIINGNEE